MVAGQTKPFNFVLQRDITVPGDTWGTTRHLAEKETPEARANALLDPPRRAEEYGLDGFSTGDHFYDSPDALIDSMACAAATNRITVTQAVLVNDFRNPALTAKMIASIDLFSGGRAEMGIGAGFNPNEYRQAGYAFEPPAVRAARLREALQIIRPLLDSAEPVTFKGEYYAVDGLLGLPRPAQDHIPFRIGGGAKRMMSIAAEFADVVDVMTAGLNSQSLPKDPQEFTRERVAKKIEFVKETAGDRAVQISFSTASFLFVPADSREEGARIALEQMDAMYRGSYGSEVGFTLSVEEMMESPYFLVGTEDDMVQHINGLRSELDITGHIVLPAFLEPMKSFIGRVKSEDQKAGLVA